MGYNTKATGVRSFAVGSETQAIGDNSTATGNDTYASGTNSTAMGINTTASGAHSTAMGSDTRASGGRSTARGESTKASGDQSTAMGSSSTASADNSTAMGYSTTASDWSATAMGHTTVASGIASTAMGYHTTASDHRSTAMGNGTMASGFSSTAMGRETTASGDYTFSLGSYATAKSACETVFGRYNTDYTPNSTTTWDAADRLLVVGNGTSTTPSNAMVILKNGKVGIGQDNPTAGLHVRRDKKDEFAVKIANSLNPSSGYAHGLSIRAGGSGNGNNSGHYFVIFTKPNGVSIGGIRQETGASVSYLTTSDSRLKTQIVDTRFGIEDLMNIQVSDYRYKVEMDKLSTGFIAQQLYDVYPQAVAPGGDDELKDPWMVDYGKVTPLIVKSVQEQQEIIDSQQAVIDQLLQQLQVLTERVEMLEN